LFNGQIGISQPFQLSAVLLAPGTELLQDTVIGMHLQLGLGGARPISVGAYNMGDIPPYSYGESGLGHTLSIYAMDVPAGVSWTSSAGVFLSNLAPPVPEAPTLALMFGGLTLIIWQGIRKKRMMSDVA